MYSLVFAEAANQEGSWLGTLITVAFMAIVVLIFYFMIVRPQKNEEKKRKALLETIEIGDSVVTTAGFYGVVIDMINEQNIVVVEFGNNKNCRIPMKKTAIVEVEKATVM